MVPMVLNGILNFLDAIRPKLQKMSSLAYPATFLFAPILRPADAQPRPMVRLAKHNHVRQLTNRSSVTIPYASTYSLSSLCDTSTTFHTSLSARSVQRSSATRGLQDKGFRKPTSTPERKLCNSNANNSADSESDGCGYQSKQHLACPREPNISAGK